MSFHFTGAGRTRAPVTLGGTSTLAADPARSAREQRLEREQQRRRQLASVRIQSQARRILESRQARNHWQLQARQLLEQLEAGSLVDAKNLSPLVLATRALLVSLGPGSRQLDQSDAELFLRWIRLVSQSIDGTKLVFLPFQLPHQNGLVDSWSSLLRMACTHSLRFLRNAAALRIQNGSETALPSTLDVEILSFLSLITGVDARSPASSISFGKQQQTLASSLLSLLLDLGLHRTLRSHILSFTVKQKATASSLSSAVSLALAPIPAFKVQASPSSKPSGAPRGASLKDAIPVDEGPEKSDIAAIHRKAVHSFAVHFMTIPALRKRLPLALVTELARQLPFSQLIEWISSFTPNHIRIAPPQADLTIYATSQDASDAAQALSQPYLLSNFLAFGSQRVSFFSDGASLAQYLRALTNAQNWLPRSAFEPPTSPNAPKSNGAAHNAAGSEAAETYERLRILVSDNHFATILALSNRFPTSTRESLFAFICSTVSTWPLDMRDHVLNRLLYSATETQGAQQSKQSRPLGPTGTGLIRDFWRGYVRGSPLARSLASAHDNTRAREILSSLSDPGTSQEWPALILVLEMISKVLLTLGDDEFLPSDDDNFSINGGGGARSSARWLSRDEILSISGLLRNVAFAMYWYEGKAPLVNLDGGEVDDPRSHARTPRVPGMRMTLLSLRTLVTTLLKQLHARDSRHRFAPAEHWLMVSHLDLNDFIRTVVLEEEQLSSEQQQRPQQQQQRDGSDAFGTSAGNASASQTASDPPVPGGIERSSEGNDENDDDDDMDVSEDEEDARQSSQPLARLQQLRAQGGARSRHLSALNLAFLSPRLGILNNVPFMIPFDVRVQIFRQFVHIDAVENGIYTDRYQRRRAVQIRPRGGYRRWWSVQGVLDFVGARGV
ncbi:hypothetical protein EX895_000646 [Sporisorium graminicola]|uniref:HECT-type E3 ubiquitin transferase n=1 Tax=Sporisorium graminicola TaxID=280036 RepID=A0A4U7L3Z3_9BASI|nr:hypothetical protein EX895_000646 [Sporisorium graminicola]TKY90648.1 hypothetical protein EX895_000646 [Sporisorium graminicola]